MECYYHPDRNGTDVCAICGKSICKECGLEIAGKVYCKECLEKIVGIGVQSAATAQPTQAAAAPEPIEPVAPEPIRTEPARLNKREPVDETIYQPQAEVEEVPPVAQPEVEPAPQIKQVSDDSPYNIKDNIEYMGEPEPPYIQKEPETSYIPENEPVQQIQERPISQQPQIAQNEYDYPAEQIQQQPVDNAQEYIYPDHSYEPQPTSARVELEDKYERYLDDLYFDEKEVPLNEQLAKDEAEYGSLTRKPYQPRKEPAVPQKRAPKNETPEEMEARIRAEIMAEQKGEKLSDNIHNIKYDDENEPMGAVDIVLTIILVIVILVVLYYVIYLIFLSATYTSFMDAIYALTNPQNVINNIIAK